MSTCPENDIHSIYLDNELPENFIAEYEAHINSCPKCRAKLEAMRKTHDLFRNDSKSIELDADFMEKSFDRLTSRMRFTKVVSEASQEKTLMFPVKKYLPAAAAAALVFAIMLPVNSKARQNTENAAVAQLKTIKRTTDFSFDQRNLAENCSMVNYPLELAAGYEMPVTFDGVNTNSTFTLNSFNPMLETQTAVPVAQFRSRGYNRRYRNLMADDFFAPTFAQPADSSLKVYMPAYVDISALNK